MVRTVLAAAFVIAASPALAQDGDAVSVSRSIDLTATPAEAWAAVGSFCDIAEWHPAITGCTLDGEVRTLALDGGGTIVETELARDDGAMRYTYAIDESPLPVSDYESTIAVSETSGGSRIDWSGTFTPAGASADEASQVIAGIYDAGLNGIAQRAAR